MFSNVVWFQSPNCNGFPDINYCPIWFLVRSTCQLENLFLECSQYFSIVHLTLYYNVVKFQSSNCKTFREMNYCPVWSLVKSTCQLGKFFLECNQYFCRMRLTVFHNVVKLQTPNCKTFRDMNYCPVCILVKSTRQLEKFFLECNRYFSRMRLTVFYNVVKFQTPNCNTEFWLSPHVN